MRELLSYLTTYTRGVNIATEIAEIKSKLQQNANLGIANNKDLFDEPLNKKISGLKDNLEKYKNYYLDGEKNSSLTIYYESMFRILEEIQQEISAIISSCKSKKSD